ncbi:DUF3068 domain-containing protein [Epidermidibacterium keratini]
MAVMTEPQADAPAPNDPKRPKIVLPAALIGIGALLIGLAILFPTVILDGVKKTPIEDTTNTSIAKGSGTIFDAESGELVEYNDVTATRLVTIDTQASDNDVAVFVATLCVRKTGEDGGDAQCNPDDDPEFLSYSYDRVATDRYSANAVNDSKYEETTTEGEVDGTKHEGLTYKFPFDVTPDGDYQVYNADAGGTTKAEYQGEEEIQGVTVYKFQVDFGEQDYQIQNTFPGTIRNVITYWVEPTTGLIIKGNQKQTQTFENGDLAADVDLTFTDENVNNSVERAKESLGLLNIVKLWAPLATGVIGLALVVGGVLILMKRRRGQKDEEPHDPYATPAYSG